MSATSRPPAWGGRSSIAVTVTRGHVSVEIPIVREPDKLIRASLPVGDPIEAVESPYNPILSAL